MNKQSLRSCRRDCSQRGKDQALCGPTKLSPLGTRPLSGFPWGSSQTINRSHLLLGLPDTKLLNLDHSPLPLYR